MTTHKDPRTVWVRSHISSDLWGFSSDDSVNVQRSQGSIKRAEKEPKSREIFHRITKHTPNTTLVDLLTQSTLCNVEYVLPSEVGR